MAGAECAQNGSDFSLLRGHFHRELGGDFRSAQKPGADSALGILGGRIRLHCNKITKPDGAEFYDLNTSSLEGAIKFAANRQFIVPNPFHSRTGRTKTGKPAIKSDGQVKSRRFLVIEFDFRAFEWTEGFSRKESLDYQARLHWHLANEYPLCLLVYSGNESVHAWFATLRPAQLMCEAAELGADTRLWSLSQFTRMPAGRHANGTRQRVVFFQPENAVPL